MPDPDDDFEARLAVLEREIARLREQTVLTNSDAVAARADAAAARVLAAGADRDVSEVRAELRAHIQALNALRETQLEQAREMREGFAEIRAEIREGFTKTREGFATQATGMAQITALLTKIAEPEGLTLASIHGRRVEPRTSVRSRASRAGMWYQHNRRDQGEDGSLGGQTRAARRTGDTPVCGNPLHYHCPVA